MFKLHLLSSHHSITSAQFHHCPLTDYLFIASVFIQNNFSSIHNLEKFKVILPKGHIIYLCCLVNQITGFAASSDFYLLCHFCFDCTPSVHAVFRCNRELNFSKLQDDKTAQDCSRSTTHPREYLTSTVCLLPWLS